MEQRFHRGAGGAGVEFGGRQFTHHVDVAEHVQLEQFLQPGQTQRGEVLNLETSHVPA